MKRAVLIAAAAALCIAGSAVAQDRSGGLIGSGTRTEDGQMMGSGNAAGQIMGSGGFTMTTQDQWLGNGGRSADSDQILGSGGLIGSGTRVEDGDGAETTQNGGYLGSGLSVVELRLRDGSSLLVVSSNKGMFVIAIGD